MQAGKNVPNCFVEAPNGGLGSKGIKGELGPAGAWKKVWSCGWKDAKINLGQGNVT